MKESQSKTIAKFEQEFDKPGPGRGSQLHPSYRFWVPERPLEPQKSYLPARPVIVLSLKIDDDVRARTKP